MSPGGELTLRPASCQDWPVIEELFGPRGACGGCWCMWWRVPRGGKLWESVKGEPNRESLRRLVEQGGLHAILAFDNGRPVGWCCFGPRSTFPRLETVRALQRCWGPDTWAVVCFYIDRRWRRRGLAGRLLAAAAERAFALGAREVEGYPTVSAKGEMPGAFLYTGLPAMFEATGFEPLTGEGGSRRVYLKRPGPHDIQVDTD